MEDGRQPCSWAAAAPSHPVLLSFARAAASNRFTTACNARNSPSSPAAADALRPDVELSTNTGTWAGSGQPGGRSLVSPAAIFLAEMEEEEASHVTS